MVFIIFLTGLKQDTAGASGGGKRAPAAERAEEPQSKPRFDFYTLLQENEVEVPAPKTARRVTGPAGDGADRPSEEGPGRDKPQLVYILQAASFRDATEAEKLRAQLTLSNLQVKVETATDSRGTWHRVLVGPYQSRSKVASARETLADHKLMPLVLKRPAR